MRKKPTFETISPNGVTIPSTSLNPAQIRKHPKVAVKHYNLTVKCHSRPQPHELKPATVQASFRRALLAVGMAADPALLAAARGAFGSSPQMSQSN